MIKKLKDRFKLFKNQNKNHKEDFYEAEKNTNEYIELSESLKDKEQDKVYIKYFVLNDFTDTKGIIDALRLGNTICWVKIKPLKQKDITDVKRAIGKIKKTCEAISGDVLGIDEDYILAVPPFVEVLKK